MTWCLNALEKQDTFNDVVFTDESTIEMSANGKLFFYQPSSALQHLPAKKQKPKHAYKVLVFIIIKRNLNFYAPIDMASRGH